MWILVIPYIVLGLMIVTSGHLSLGDSGPKAPIVLGEKRRNP